MPDDIPEQQIHGGSTTGLRVFCVGGAVRDGLLGMPVQDRDWVVVGATPEEMAARGFRPVGSDFPVFLHPETHEEYALARTERKVAQGYKGFTVYAAPDVTLEQDLLRRDFTVNAMALDAGGTLVDPYGGRQDLEARVLRHVSEAFAEDPVRILRGARFAARFGFSIAPETLALMQRMVAAGEADALVAERVWQELARGLQERHPSRFFMTLRESGALARVLPELDNLFGVPQPAQHHPEIDCGLHTMMVVDEAARNGGDLAVRFAALTHDLGKATTPSDMLPRHIGHEQRGVGLLHSMCERLRVPGECRDLALLVARFHGLVHRARELRAATIVELFDHCDLWRKPARFAQVLQACAADARGRAGHADDAYPQADYLTMCAHAARDVNAGEIARACADRTLIPARIGAARIGAVEQAKSGYAWP